MSATPRKARRSRPSLRLWSYEKAMAAVPYLSSVLRSLRELALDIQVLRQRLKHFDDLHGRPTRKTIIAHEETRRDLAHREQDYEHALAELEAIDVHLVDATRGLALIPFIHDDQQAGFIFDLFDSQPIRSWRYDSDPEEMRRKVSAAQMR
ncbi:MAG: DUF2203 family protein [Gemmataceae bacterium]